MLKIHHLLHLIITYCIIHLFPLLIRKNYNTYTMTKFSPFALATVVVLASQNASAFTGPMPKAIPFSSKSSLRMVSVQNWFYLFLLEGPYSFCPDLISYLLKKLTVHCIDERIAVCTVGRLPFRLHRRTVDPLHQIRSQRRNPRTHHQLLRGTLLRRAPKDSHGRMRSDQIRIGSSHCETDHGHYGYCRCGEID